MSIVSQSSPGIDDNSLLSSKKKRRRGGSQYCTLLRYMSWFDHVGSNGYKTLSDACFEAECFIEQRAKLQRKPEQYFNAGVIIVSLKEGLLTEAEWEDLRLLHNTTEWTNAMDSLFERIMGRKPDRSNTKMLNFDALDLWDRIKLPYTEEQFQYLQRAWEYSVENGDKFSHADKKKYYYTPLNFDDLSLPPISKPAPQATVNKSATGNGNAPSDKFFDTFSMIFYLQATPDRQARFRATWKRQGRNDLLELVGYDESEIEIEAINPEQIAHEDQERIDAAFRNLLAGVNL